MGLSRIGSLCASNMTVLSPLPSSRRLQLGDLQSILSSMNIPVSQGGTTSQGKLPYCSGDDGVVYKTDLAVNKCLLINLTQTSVTVEVASRG